ncbi:unnamed protein product [Blepharisma stoltei]|uniref:Uncharacterized protein n=1 Tax=Blepharisma stoltei TaxID=1481888 RepID=A0AAU9JFF1_9CILI|nr:unnamed protein product [Blepharisma stoltei]
MGNCCARNQCSPPAKKGADSFHLVCDESMLRSTFKESFKLSHYEGISISKHLTLVVDESVEEDDDDLTKSSLSEKDTNQVSAVANVEGVN